MEVRYNEVSAYTVVFIVKEQIYVSLGMQSLYILYIMAHVVSTFVYELHNIVIIYSPSSSFDHQSISCILLGKGMS